MRLIRIALKRSQFYLCAEILRFLIPPQDGAAVQWGPAGAAAQAAAPGGAAEGGAAAGGSKQPSSTTDSSGTGGSWFGWLWGGSSGQKAEAAADHAPLVSQRSSAAAAAAAAAGMPHGTDACSIVADRAWLLLEQVCGRARLGAAACVRSSAVWASCWLGGFQTGRLLLLPHCAVQGKLVQLVQLIHSMAFLTGGLAAIMATSRPANPASQQPNGLQGGSSSTASAAPQESEEELSVDVLLGCVLAAVEELPVWEGSDVEADAVLVLELAQALQVQRWSVALAVVLVDMAVLGPFAAAHPELWTEFCAALLEVPALYFLHALAEAAVAEASE